MTELKNRLASSLSPYLQQHATNPVHWQPWDEQVLAAAKQQDKPILLSIGYAACHWCHVMAHESFANQHIADLMNDNFICIKVDREERPDLDKIYQETHYLLSRTTGGWPLTVFLAPDLAPFFSGTYYPPTPRGRMPAFSDILLRVKTAWESQRPQIEEQNRRLCNGLHEMERQANIASGAIPERSIIVATVENLLANFDSENGGLGKAPKFPQVPALMFLLEQVNKSGAEQLQVELNKTLNAIASGGLQDHIGGGFFRYCVDPLWDIPHFEKMLYDNAQLLELFALAAKVLANEQYAQLARITANWLIEDMQIEGGGFVSAIDADSEGGEGSYYIWERAELEKLLSTEEVAQLETVFNLASIPNFVSSYHLHYPANKSWQPPNDKLSKVLAKLNQVRKLRPAPAVDDKVLAHSCGIAALALARTGNLLGDEKMSAAAQVTVRFVDKELTADGKLFVAWREDKRSPTAAYLDDYALLAAAKFELLQFNCDQVAVDSVLTTLEMLLDKFDDGVGGLRFVEIGGEEVLRVQRSADDGAVPAGNAIAASVLLQAGWLFGNQRLLTVAERIFSYYAQMISGAGAHCPSLLKALSLWHDKPNQIVLFGPTQELLNWRNKLCETKQLDAIYLVGEQTGLTGSLNQTKAEGKPIAKICGASGCSLPIKQLTELVKQIKS